MTDAQRGCNSHGRHDPQVNLMYALAVDGEKACPVFYKSHPGSVRDASAFGNMMHGMGMETAVILADKGFHGSGDLGENLHRALQQHSPSSSPKAGPWHAHTSPASDGSWNAPQAAGRKSRQSTHNAWRRPSPGTAGRA